MKKVLIMLLAVAAALGIAQSASATSFTINGAPGLTISGTATGAGPSYLVGGAGTFSLPAVGTFAGVSGEAFTVVATGSVLPAGSNLKTQATGFDNTIYSGANTDPFDSHGVLIKLANGDYVLIKSIGGGLDVVDIYNSKGKFIGGEVYGLDPVSNGPGGLTNTPEPSSLLLLGTGLLAMACIVFWKARSSKRQDLVLTSR